MVENRKDKPIKEEPYIDVVSSTIISRLSEVITRIMTEKLTNSLNKLLLADIPEVISKEITPAFDKVQKEILKAVEVSGEKLRDEVKDIRHQVEKSAGEQSGLLADILLTTKKMPKNFQGPAADISKEIKETLDMGIRGMLKQLEKGSAIHQTLRKELEKVSLEMESATKGNADLLKSVFSSVKKPIATLNKDMGMDTLRKEREREIEEELLGYKKRQMEEFNRYLKTQRENIIKDIGETKGREEAKIKSMALDLFEAQKKKIIEYFENLKDKEVHEVHTHLKNFLDDKQRELNSLFGDAK